MVTSIKNPAVISVSAFKAHCLRLLQSVAESDQPLVITKRGNPIARVVPFRRRGAPLFGAHRGQIRVLGDIVAPTGARWEAEK